ncbi:MAG: glycosyltransferase family 4 protein [Bacteroidia bacterium]|nr:glycosyltransferase family 4 protein [Bacteroidia bacterium]
MSRASSGQENDENTLTFTEDKLAFRIVVHKTLGDLINHIESAGIHKRIGVLIIDHDAGGGANLYRNDLIRGELNDANFIHLLYYDKVEQKYSCDFYINDVKYVFKSPLIKEIDQLCDLISYELIYVNELIGYKDPFYVFNIVKRIKESQSAKCIVLVHDYFSICPSYTLLDHKNKYCGIPDDINVCQNCLKKLFAFPGVQRDIVSWRENWEYYLNETADEIFCFSNSSRDLLIRVYPLLKEKIEVRPHVVRYIDPVEVERSSEVLTIGFLGGLNYQKGVDVFKELLIFIAKENLKVKVVLIGYTDESDAVLQKKYSDFLTITGKYNRESIEMLIQEHEVDVFFVASIIPETFSFTTEEIIKMNVPIAVFDLGAQAERVRAYEKGIVLKSISIESVYDELINHGKEWLKIS